MNQIPEVDPFGTVTLIIAPDALIDKVVKVKIFQLFELRSSRREEFFADFNVIIHRTADIEEEQYLDLVVQLWNHL